MPQKLIDITGQKFGRFTVLRYAGKDGKSSAWECVCECGTVKRVRAERLRGGYTQSCGCWARECARETALKHVAGATFLDIAGQKFGRLTVIRRADSSSRRTMWECACECGGSKIVDGANLKSGSTTSCGCFHKEVARGLLVKHGLSKHPLFAIWRKMIDRCDNENNKDYHCYGGRGIKLCDRWRSDFQNFYDDMSGTYQVGLSIERRDVNLGYSPENCEWIPLCEQSKNRRPRSEWKLNRGKDVPHERGIPS